VSDDKATRIERALRQYHEGPRCKIEDATDESDELAEMGFRYYSENKWHTSFSEAATGARIAIIRAVLTAMNCPVIEKDWCAECRGIGHGKDCKCEGMFGFVMGCCKTCAGDGMVRIERPQLPPKIDEGWRRPKT